MKAMARALESTGLLLASFVVGCGNSGTNPGGGPTRPGPQVSVVTADLSTSAHVATVRITNTFGEISPNLVDTVAARIRVATWPGGVEVATTETRTTLIPTGTTPIAESHIEKQLDPTLDASAWYAISLPPDATDYGMPFNPSDFAFAGGARGARFSPAHAPVVASVLSCVKDGGVVAVYARYSEPVVRAAGAPALDYGATPVSCAVGGDSTVETQFICTTAAGGSEPFSLRIPDGVTAQGSGAAMTPGTLDSTGMQTDTTADGCTVRKPLLSN